MIKVIKHGKLHNKITCKKCDAEMEFDPLTDPICINTAVGYAGETWEPRFIISCPDCGENIYLNRLTKKAKEDAIERMKIRSQTGEV